MPFSLFMIIFCLADKIRKLHQRIDWCLSGKRTKTWFRHYVRNKSKGDCCGIRNGEKNTTVGIQEIFRGNEKQKQVIQGLQIKLCIYIYIAMWTSCPQTITFCSCFRPHRFSIGDGRSLQFSNLSRITVFSPTVAETYCSSLHKCLFSEVSVDQLVFNHDTSMWLQSE